MCEALADIKDQDSRMNQGACSFLEGKLLCHFNSCEPLSSCGAVGQLPAAQGCANPKHFVIKLPSCSPTLQMTHQVGGCYLKDLYE